jgi:bacterioferritin-associated ferredoxin
MRFSSHFSSKERMDTASTFLSPSSSPSFMFQAVSFHTINSLLRIIRIRVIIFRMIVCVCKNINESSIHRAAHNGHDSFEALQVELGVAMGCGKCASSVHDMLAQCAGSRCPSRSPAQPKQSAESNQYFVQLAAA